MRRIVRKTTSSRRAPAHRVRIIGGRWRGVRLEFPDVAAVRPSGDRVRETLFNWLQPHVFQTRCLDLFAGAGALGLEALSRGAAHVTFVDREPRVGAHLRGVLQKLRAAELAAVIVEDAERFLQRPPQRFDIVFLDPPFAAGLSPQVFNALARGWLADPAWVYVERAAQTVLPPLPPGWSVHRAGRAGQVGYDLLRAAR